MPIRALFLSLLILSLAALAYQVLKYFWIPVCWAVILVYITWPFYVLLNKLVQKEILTSFLMALLLASFIIIPLVWSSFLLQAEIVEFYKNLPIWLEKKPILPGYIAKIPYLGDEIESIFQQSDDFRALLKENIVPELKRFYKPALSFIEHAGLMAGKLGLSLLIAFFFYKDGLSLIQQLKKLMRLALIERTDAYFKTIAETLQAIVYGIVLTAIAQGTLAGLGYWFVGIKAPLLLALITMFVALIPFGTPFVWGLASVWLFMNDQVWPALSLALWGALVVSWVDNLIRPLVISNTSRIPFLLVFFGVMGGLAEFGFIGLFIGPVILAIVLAVWREGLTQE